MRCSERFTLGSELGRPRSANCSNELPTRADYTNGMHHKVGALRGTFFIGAGLLAASFAAFGEHRLISLGERRLSIDCDGEAGSATVVLIAGGGEMAKDWAKVQ